MSEIKIQEYIIEEVDKCMNSPYYFATKYLIVKDRYGVDHKFQTPLSESEFNNMFKNYE